jgi:ssDNA-binding Zn-finger/Zn-ribbon topoisomerase 1
MISRTRCSQCGQDIAYPDTWAGRTIVCSKCRGKVQLKGEQRKRAVGHGQPSARKSLKIVLSLATILGASFCLSSGKSAPAVQVSMVPLRCTHCDAQFERLRPEWETEVFDTGAFQIDAEHPLPTHTEQTATTCPQCNHIAAYLQERTVKCERCGHWMPAADPALAKDFRQPPGCSHCPPPTP